MVRDSIHRALKDIGEKLKKERESRNWTVAKIQALSGLNPTTINRIEDGSNAKVATLLEYCFALELHPKELMDLEMEVSPKIPPTKNDEAKKFAYTAGVKQLINDGFFRSWKSTGEVQEALEVKFQIKDLVSKNISSTLGKLVKNKALIISRDDNPFLYKINKDPKKD